MCAMQVLHHRMGVSVQGFTVDLHFSISPATLLFLDCITSLPRWKASLPRGQ